MCITKSQVSDNIDHPYKLMSIHRQGSRTKGGEGRGGEGRGGRGPREEVPLLSSWDQNYLETNNMYVIN